MLGGDIKMFDLSERHLIPQGFMHDGQGGTCQDGFPAVRSRALRGYGSSFHFWLRRRDSILRR